MLPVNTGTMAYNKDHTRNGTNTREKRRLKNVAVSVVSGTSRKDDAITKSGTACRNAPSIRYPQAVIVIGEYSSGFSTIIKFTGVYHYHHETGDYTQIVKEYDAVGFSFHIAKLATAVIRNNDRY